MLKIGVVGAGHLGKIHMKCIDLIPQYEAIGFYDINKEHCIEVEKELGWKALNSLEELIDICDVIDIVTPTIHHFEVAEKAIKKGKHIFIEKPVTQTLEQAQQLLNLQKEYSVKIQVGHVERFNPAFQAIDIDNIDPMFIEVHRLAAFNPRGTDVSVILDLMIHDIDIMLQVVKSEINSIAATGVAVVSPAPDIANVRIEFKNGCVVNLTASRISMKQMRKMRMFQKDAYISLDFLEKNVQMIRLLNVKPEDGFLSEWDTTEGKKYIQGQFPEIISTNAIKEELESFLYCILKDTEAAVPLQDAYEALKVALRISKIIKNNHLNIKS